MDTKQNLLLRATLKAGMVVQTLNPSRQKQVGFCESKVYLVSSRPFRYTQPCLVSNSNKKTSVVASTEQHSRSVEIGVSEI